MVKCQTTITKEQYDRAQEHNGSIPKEDEDEVFGTAVTLGYGLYGNTAFKEENPETGKTEYYVIYYRGDSCD